MKVTERYVNLSERQIKDTQNQSQSFLSVKQVCDLLNQQDARIKQLENQLSLQKSKSELVAENEAMKDTIAVVLAQKRNTFINNVELRKENQQLKEQLSNKNKQLRVKIGNMKSTDFIKMCISCGFLVDAKVVDNQDKISLAIEQLEKIKDDLLDISSPYWQYFAKTGNAFMTYEDIEQWVKEYIDIQIKELRSGK